MKKFFSRVAKAMFAGLTMPLIYILALMVLVSAITINTLRKYPETAGLLKGPSILQKEKEGLVVEVGSLIALPEGEEPSVATVSDKEQLAGQSFFNNALEGDKLLIYVDARKVYLYRPSENRVVEVGSINIQNREAVDVQGQEKLGSVRVVFLNGTQVAGLTAVVEDQLKDSFPEAEIERRANANESDYEETIVVDLLGNRGEAAGNIASALGVKVGELPEGEDVVDEADFLIIVGSDRIPSVSDTE